MVFSTPLDVHEEHAVAPTLLHVVASGVEEKAPLMVDLSTLFPPVVAVVDVQERSSSPDLRCYETIEEAQRPLDDRHRSDRLKAKELNSKEIVATAVIRIKKCKLSVATPSPPSGCGARRCFPSRAFMDG